MTITVANTLNTNTFDYWRNRTNELADAMTNYVVTTDSNTAVGNASISGQFYANVLVANSILRVGNVSINSSSISSISITPPASNIFSILANTAFKIPEGTSASRPTGETGLIRYNTTESKYEVYLGGQWENVVTESVQVRIYDASNTQLFP